MLHCDLESKAGRSKWLVDLSSAAEVRIQNSRFVSPAHVGRALRIDDPFNRPVPKVEFMQMTGTPLSGALNQGGTLLGANTTPTLSGFLTALASGLKNPVDYP